MRNKEYNAYKIREDFILNKFKKMNVDDLIINDLKTMNLNIDDINIKYLISIIKKIVYDYYMFGISKTYEMLENNKDYIFYTIETKNLEIENIEKKITEYFENDKNYYYDKEVFKNFIMSSAERVQKKMIIEEEKNKVKKLALI